MVSNPDTIVEHHAQVCGSCQNILTINDVIKLGSTHQVFDLPEQKLWVTEHQLNISRCRCRCQTKAISPSNLAVCPVQYGSSIKSLSVYLNTEFKLPFNKINTLFSDLYGYQFNESTAWSANQLAFERLENIENQIQERLLEAHVLHANETGIRCAGSLYWLHVTSNPLYTYLFVHQKRGKIALESDESILPKCGILSFTFYQELLFTNNQTERNLRMVKTKIKVSTCFRTWGGAKHYARIQGFISTIRKQQMNPFQKLKLVFDHQFQWTYFLNKYLKS